MARACAGGVNMAVAVMVLGSGSSRFPLALLACFFWAVIALFFLGRVYVGKCPISELWIKPVYRMLPVPALRTAVLGPGVS